MPTAILRGAGAVPRSLTQLGVSSFKLGGELTNRANPSILRVFQALPDAFLCIRLRGVIQLLVALSFDGHGVILILNAVFFKKAIEAGAAVVKCRKSSNVHFSPFSLVLGHS